MISLISLCLLSVLVVCQQECNNTHLDFFSQYSLGKQDQLNRTFTKIQKNINSIETIDYQYNETIKYTISNIKPKLYYRDSKQKAQISQQTILVFGGTLQVEFSFGWTWTAQSMSKSGTALGYFITQQIKFGKKVAMDKGFYVFTLSDLNFLTVNSDAILMRIQSSNTTQDDIKAIKKMLNDLPNHQALKFKAVDALNVNYKNYLNESLHDDSYQPIQDQAYIWQDPLIDKGKLIVNFTNRPTGVIITKQGIVMTYNTVLKDFTTWKCGNYSAPSNPQDKQIYGGIQEFISHTILENTVRLARDKGFFNTKLNRMNWESRFNQFFAGDLYEVIPKIGETFAAGTPVQGMCTAEKDTYAYRPGGGHNIDVMMNYKCNLTISQTEVARFGLVLDTSVEGRANNTHLNFHVVHNAVSNITYENVGQYIVQNKVLAQTMINHSLNRLLQHRTFGSGWRLYTRDYPQFAVFDKYVLIFDSSHVGNSQIYDS